MNHRSGYKFSSERLSLSCRRREEKVSHNFWILMLAEIFVSSRLFIISDDYSQIKCHLLINEILVEKFLARLSPRALQLFHRETSKANALSRKLPASNFQTFLFVLASQSLFKSLLMKFTYVESTKAVLTHFQANVCNYFKMRKTLFREKLTAIEADGANFPQHNFLLSNCESARSNEISVWCVWMHEGSGERSLSAVREWVKCN